MAFSAEKALALQATCIAGNRYAHVHGYVGRHAHVPGDEQAHAALVALWGLQGRM